MDQIFVELKHWLVGLAPDPWQPLVSALLSTVAILAVFASLFALSTLLERKGLGRIRIGTARIASARSVCCSRSRTASRP